MKRSILAVAALSLAIPFAASARPVASFNDHAEHYTSAPESRVVSERIVLAGGEFNYPAY
ncbi:MAG: hypothetical protein AB7O31_19055 [Burkholderiales bacterium]